MVALIRGGVTTPGGTWADFGAGTGNFTAALRDLLGPEATLYAVDVDGRALERLRGRLPGARAIAADFRHPLALPPLDGALLANALHWVAAGEQAATLRRLAGSLRTGGRLLVVEYETRRATGAVPYPVPFERFRALAAEAGLAHVERIGTRRSPRTGGTMYAARGIK